MNTDVKKQYLLRVEFRYHVVPKSDVSSESTFRKLTIGVYDNLEDAIDNGNATLNKIKANGLQVRDCFKLNDFLGRHTDLVTNCCSNDHVHYFVTIRTLTYDDINEIIGNVKSEDDKWRKWRE